MEEEFWFESSPRRKRSSVITNSGVYFILLVVIACTFIFIIIPSFLSFTSHIFQPSSVKKNWEYVNIVLVLFAIICGFLSKNNNDEGSSRGFIDQEQVPLNMYDGSQRTMMRRNSSSYPDLRQESPWLHDEDRPRFYDDSHVPKFGVTSFENGGDLGAKNTDNVSYAASEQPKAKVKRKQRKSYAMDEPPRPPVVQQTVNVEHKAKNVSVEHKPKAEKQKIEINGGRHKARRSYGDLISLEKTESDLKKDNLQMGNNRRTKSLENLSYHGEVLEMEPLGQEQKKNVGGTKQQRKIKKKRQRHKSTENLETLFPYQPSHPPPAPPISLFNQWFSKKNKTKKVRSSSPPPAPPISAFHQWFSNNKKKKKNKGKKVHQVHSQAPPTVTKTVQVEMTHSRPPLPVKIRSSNENPISSGGESPLVSILKPPPPPPFKVPSWKFEEENGFVRVRSLNYSSDEGDASCSKDSGVLQQRGMSDSSSPDVDSKADNFIAMMKQGFRMEKLNSLKEKVKHEHITNES